MLTKDEAISFEYDAENNRTLKNEYGKTTSYVVNPNAALSQVLMSTTGNETTYYIYGLGLIAQEKANNYNTYHYDYRGSTTAITDNNGNVTDRIYYDAYGSIINRTGTTETPFLYVGKYGVETDDSGLYYMRARYYNPTIQRFVNIDPIRDGYNWYGYVGGNPINFVDYFGTTRIDDGKYNYETQIKIINYSVEYNEAKRNNDKKGMEEAQKKADALRVKSNEPWVIDTWGREQAGYFNMATIAVFDIADQYFVENSFEYGEFVSNSLNMFVENYVSINVEYNLQMMSVFIGSLYYSLNAKYAYPPKAVKIAKKIKANNGNVPRGYKGGRKFKNNEKLLPQNVKYYEYDINPYKNKKIED